MMPWIELARCIAFVGPPGSGKTTQVRLLQEALEGRILVASVPRLVRREPELMALLTASEAAELAALTPAAAAARAGGELAPFRLDEILFEAVARAAPLVTVALDGCPRGLEQARGFLSFGRLAEGTLLAELFFQGDLRARSFERQLARETLKRGRADAAASEEVYRRKTEVFVEDTTAGLGLLKAAVLRHVRLDADLPPARLHDLALEAAGLNIRVAAMSGAGP